MPLIPFSPAIILLMTLLPPLPWEQPAWQADSQAWIAACLSELGLPAPAPVELVHARPWSAVWRVTTPKGPLFFKAACPLLAREASLTAWLQDRQPGLTFPLLAADFERGWMLLPDGGPALRSFLRAPADLRRVDALLPAFASLQIETSARPQEVLARVPFDRRPALLPSLFAALLEDVETLRPGQQDGLSADHLRRLHLLQPRFADICAELADGPIPPALHHDDFHDGNLYGSSETGPLRVADWGEAALAHPFFSLIILLRALAGSVGLPDETTDVPERLPAELARLRDLYLTPWEQFTPLPELQRIFSLAWRAGMVSRALTWQAVVASFDPPRRSPYRAAAPAWLGEFLTLMEQSQFSYYVD